MTTECKPWWRNAVEAPKTRISPSVLAVSPLIGLRQYYDITVHDDGITAIGGITTGIASKPGWGKSTLLMQIAQTTAHVPGAGSKNAYFNHRDHLVPETVIWRGKPTDQWAVFFPEHWDNAFPGTVSKPIYLHIHASDRLKFIYDDPGSPPEDIIDAYEKSRHYRDIHDLYSNIVQGAINVVYPPTQYALPEETTERLYSEGFFTSHRRYDPSEPIVCPSFYWWYEFFETLCRIKGREYITLLMDEAGDLLASGSKDLYWQLISHFAENVLVNFRKLNVSSVFAVHGMTLVDYRPRERFQFMIWLPTSYPQVRHGSRVHPRLISALPDRGWAITEELSRRFGRIEFPPVREQPPIVKMVSETHIPIPALGKRRRRSRYQ